MSALRPGRFTPGKDPVYIVQEAGWAPGPVWMGADDLAHTAFRSPDHPARGESLYRLRYPGRLHLIKTPRNNHDHSRQGTVLSNGGIVQLTPLYILILIILIEDIPLC